MNVYLVGACYLHLLQNDRDLLHATALTREWNRHRNKSRFKKLTLENKILPPLLPGLEPATFRSRVRPPTTEVSPLRLLLLLLVINNGIIILNELISDLAQF